MSASLAARVRDAAERLRAHLDADQNATLDAEVLARHALGWTRETWIARSRETPPPGFDDAFDALVARRATGEPIAYITGTREFWGLDFEVTPAVLVPRPETEVLVEEALKIVDALRARHPDRALVLADVGTGSGCIAVTLAHERPAVRVIATDVSEAALDVAVRNAARHAVSDRVEFRHTSVLDGVAHVDLIVSNPPYIGAGDPAVSAAVAAHEPHIALYSGADGLDVIRGLAAAAMRMRPAPPLLFEFGGNEAAARAAVEPAGLGVTRVVRDLAGIPRVAIVEA